MTVAIDLPPGGVWLISPYQIQNQSHNSIHFVFETSDLGLVIEWCQESNSLERKAGNIFPAKEITIIEAHDDPIRGLFFHYH